MKNRKQGVHCTVYRERKKELLLENKERQRFRRRDRHKKKERVWDRERKKEEREKKTDCKESIHYKINSYTTTKFRMLLNLLALHTHKSDQIFRQLSLQNPPILNKCIQTTYVLVQPSTPFTLFNLIHLLHSPALFIPSTQFSLVYTIHLLQSPALCIPSTQSSLVYAFYTVQPYVYLQHSSA